ncbi:MAG: hypothetical protein MUF54_04565 [Polyangiaceae bacterium]|nr:hypothetical protein [Polyangiaceae bacterium]
MRPIGFSTGALALADFRLALGMVESDVDVKAIELSALRVAELNPLVAAIASLDLSRYSYIAVHAPSAFSRAEEPGIVDSLEAVSARGWPIVIHPDAVHDWSLWRQFERLLCIENMDKRKPIGRSAHELAACFDKAPNASLCLDLGHARQVDPSMSGAHAILRDFGDRLVQVHLSEVATDSRHDRLSYSAALAFQQIAGLIPERTPIILETPVTGADMTREIKRARQALTAPLQDSGQRMTDSMRVAAF